MDALLTFKKITDEVRERLASYANAPRPPGLPADRCFFIHLDEFGWDPAAAGRTYPVLLVRYVNGRSVLYREATPQEVEDVRDARRREVQGHIQGERGMMGECPGGW